MKIDKDNEMLEFACMVCHIKSKEKNPNIVDCAFRYFDYEYCPYIEQALREKKQQEQNLGRQDLGEAIKAIMNYVKENNNAE